MNHQPHEADRDDAESHGEVEEKFPITDLSVPSDALDQFQQILLNLELSGAAPILCAKALRFLREHGDIIREGLNAPILTPAQWVDDLFAPAGVRSFVGADSNVETAMTIVMEGLAQIWQQTGGIPGTLKQWCFLLLFACDKIGPQELEEWQELARLVPFTDTVLESYRSFISETAAHLKPSIDAGLVAVDINSIAEQDLPQAAALCYYWHTRFAVLSQLAFPSTTDVHAFARMCDVKPPIPNSLEELNLGVWLQRHPAWSGMLRSLSGTGHPLLAVLCQGSSRPETGFLYLVEIDSQGVMLSLRNVVEANAKGIAETTSSQDESWYSQFGLKWSEKTKEIWREGREYKHIPRTKLSPSQWDLFSELMRSGKHGTTAASLMEKLGVKEGALAQRKNQLKNALFPFGLTVPDGKYHVADC